MNIHTLSEAIAKELNEEPANVEVAVTERVASEDDIAATYTIDVKVKES